MEIFNNDFKVTFTNAAASNKAKQIADECLRNLHFDHYSVQPSILAADSLITKRGAILSFNTLCFISEDLMVASRKVIKAIAFGMSEESFEFAVCGSDTYTESWVDGSFSNGCLEMVSTFFPEGYSEYLECPECGEEIVRIEDYDPNATYICPECGEELDFTSAAPVIEKESIKVR